MNKQWEYEEVRSFYRQSQIIGIPLSLDMRIFWASLGTYLKEENKNTIMNSLKFSPQGTSTQEESKNGSALSSQSYLVYPFPRVQSTELLPYPASNYCCPGQQGSADAFVSTGSFALLVSCSHHMDENCLLRLYSRL